MSDTADIISVIKSAVQVVELAEAAVEGAINALAKGKADLTRVLAEKQALQDRLDEQHAAKDKALDDKFDK